MKLLLDMNLSPEWVRLLQEAGHDAVHWSVVGEPTATDRTIMAWARANDRVVFTHDLDFGHILAATAAEGPSVIQIRTQDIAPNVAGPVVLRALRQFSRHLERGALLVIHEGKSRARLLPLRPSRKA